ncbi:MAG: hypothetical protein U1E52_12550 [Geminicoccaceae bacterium]
MGDAQLGEQLAAEEAGAITAFPQMLTGEQPRVDAPAAGQLS